MEWFLLCGAGVCILQLALLAATRRRFRPLRACLPTLAALLLLLAPVCLCLPGQFLGPQIAALFCATTGAALAAACALAWGIFALWNRRQT